MNLNFLIKKKHIFKRRKLYNVSPPTLKYFNSGIFTLNPIRFEFIYLKVIKKLFRKKYKKKKTNYLKSKFWVLIRPNFLLTMKSKNSRMGSGVGSYVRVCSVVKNNTPIIFFKYLSLFLIKKHIKYFKMKLNINTYLSHL